MSCRYCTPQPCLCRRIVELDVAPAPADTQDGDEVYDPARREAS